MRENQQKIYLQEDCPFCIVLIGQPHKTGCEAERCSVCRRQKVLCDCAGHDPQSSYWTGEWPGAVECRKRGWWTVRTESGWQSCREDMPEATEDLSRLAFFDQEGYDGLYSDG